VVRSFVLNHGLAPVYARLLPDLPDAPAPQDMQALTEIISSALDDVLSSTSHPNQYSPATQLSNRAASRTG
jgi:hypothetical protein